MRKLEKLAPVFLAFFLVFGIVIAVDAASNRPPVYGSSITTPVSVANGGTAVSSASITAFNNITGYTAAGATGTTSTNLVFSTSATLTSPTLITPALGVPASGTLTSCTGLPAAGVLNPIGNAQAGTSYTFALSDGYGGVVVSGSSGSATAFTIPTNASVAFPLYTSIVVLQLGAGAITISGAGGVTVTSSGGTAAAPIINAQYQAAVCYKTATDAWTVYGNIK